MSHRTWRFRWVLLIMIALDETGVADEKWFMRHFVGKSDMGSSLKGVKLQATISKVSRKGAREHHPLHKERIQLTPCLLYLDYCYDYGYESLYH